MNRYTTGALLLLATVYSFVAPGCHGATGDDSASSGRGGAGGRFAFVGPAGAGGAPSGTGGAPSLTIGAGGYMHTFTCPPSLDAMPDPWWCSTLEATDACVYPSACAGDGCILRCIGNIPATICKPCGKPPDCPASPPQHGSPCATDTSEVSCNYDACADKNEFGRAWCKNGSWYVQYGLCGWPVCWISTGDQPVACFASSVCVRGPKCSPVNPSNDPPEAQDVLSCPANPCIHEPFSCACAGQYCGPGLTCTGASKGTVTCARASDPPLPQLVIGNGDYSKDISDSSEISYLAVGAGYAYWGFNQQPGRIHKASVLGGLVTILAFPASLNFMTLGGDELYYTDDDKNGKGSIYSVSVNGGSPLLLTSSQSGAGELQVDSAASAIYWTIEPTPTTASIIRRGNDGNLSTVIASQVQIDGFVVDSKNVYWLSHDSNNGDPLQSTPLAGGPTTTLANLYVADMAAAGDFIYAGTTIEKPTRIVRIPKLGGPPETLASTTETARALAVDDAYVYWTTEEGTVSKTPLAGGPTTPLALGRLYPSAIAVDDTHVYWTDNVSGPCGAIYRVPKQ